MKLSNKILKPFIQNVRFGFATNSSSSHSFIYARKGNGPAQEHLGDEAPSTHIDTEFGWNDFRLTTIREKLLYVLTDKIGGGWDDEYEGSYENAYEELWSEYPELCKEDFKAAFEGHVDHQSQGTITAKQARDPQVIVFGGYDGDVSQSRIDAIQAGVVDCNRTEPEWGDKEYIGNLPKSVQEKFHAKNRKVNPEEYDENYE